LYNNHLATLTALPETCLPLDLQHFAGSQSLSYHQKKYTVIKAFSILKTAQIANFGTLLPLILSATALRFSELLTYCACRRTVRD